MFKSNQSLNQNQEIAISHDKGPMMVLSGPGSGKTTVITYRIKNLIERYNVPETDILVITFTKSAAEEMKNRFLLLSNHKNVTFGTFHSYFYRIIRNYYKYSLNSILHDDEKLKLIRKIISDMQIFFENPEDSIQQIIAEISYLKNDMIEPTHFNSNILASNEFVQIFEKYEEYKEVNNKIDFDDMLTRCFDLLKQCNDVRKFWCNKYKYILIDEFQDINKVQYECIKLLLSDEKNLFVVGDDDQSIYSFRGSNPSFLLEFPEVFKNSANTTLNTNYRSTDEIINFCNVIISENKERYTKNMVGTGIKYNPPMLIRNYDISEEAKNITARIMKFSETYPLNEIAIIYRTNLQARAFIECFMDHNIEYQVKDKIPSIYDHYIARDIIAYMKLIIDDCDNNSFMRIANKPKRYLSKVLLLEASEICGKSSSIMEYLYLNQNLETWQIEKIHTLKFHISQMKNKSTYDAIKYLLNTIGYNDYIIEYSNFRKISPNGLLEVANEILESSKGYENILDYLTHINEISEELSKSYTKKDNTGVVLTTMHSVKGLEFDVVFVISCVDDIIPHEKSKSQTSIEEERRLFYVALTRPRKLLFISMIETKYEKDLKPSRFLKGLLGST